MRRFAITLFLSLTVMCAALVTSSAAHAATFAPSGDFIDDSTLDSYDSDLSDLSLGEFVTPDPCDTDLFDLPSGEFVNDEVDFKGTINAYSGDVSTTILSKFAGYASKENLYEYVVVRTGTYTYVMVCSSDNSSLSYSNYRFTFAGRTRICTYTSAYTSGNTTYPSTWLVSNDTNTVVNITSSTGYVYSSHSAYPGIIELENYERTYIIGLFVNGLLLVSVASKLFKLLTNWFEVVHEK